MGEGEGWDLSACVVDDTLPCALLAMCNFSVKFVPAIYHVTYLILLKLPDPLTYICFRTNLHTNLYVRQSVMSLQKNVGGVLNHYFVVVNEAYQCD